MACYREMATVYEYVFPLSEEKVRCALNCLRVTPASVLDIGCATGQLAMELAAKSHQVTGVDLNKAMIARARRDAARARNNARFFIADMRHLGEMFTPGSFDLILCTGNTLVHLQSMSELSILCRMLTDLLTPKGHVLIQILNYDRIALQRPETLPTIENDAIRFRRFYSYESFPDFVLFSTELLIKSAGTTHRDSVRLLPIRPNDLLSGLKDAGLSVTRIFSSFSKAHFTLVSDACVVLGSRSIQESELSGTAKI